MNEVRLSFAIRDKKLLEKIRAFPKQMRGRLVEEAVRVYLATASAEDLVALFKRVRMGRRPSGKTSTVSRLRPQASRAKQNPHPFRDGGGEKQRPCNVDEPTEDSGGERVRRVLGGEFLDDD